MVFTHDMRAHVEAIVAAVREMLEKRIVPPPVNYKRCEGCSLRESCLPSVVAERLGFHPVTGILLKMYGRILYSPVLYLLPRPSHRGSSAMSMCSEVTSGNRQKVFS